MAVSRQAIRGVPTNIIQDEDIIDDSVGSIPSAGLVAQKRLRERFLTRLAKMTAATVIVLNRGSPDSVELLLSRDDSSPSVTLDNELCKFVRDLQQCLRHVSTTPNGPAGNVACDIMWDALILYTYRNTQHVLETLQRLFADYDHFYDDLVTKMLWPDDVYNNCLGVDDELGDTLLTFVQDVNSYDKTPKQFSRLITSAYQMLKMKHFAKRLHCLTEEASFVSALHQLILALGFPEFAFETFVRTAKRDRAFRNVTFHLTKPKAAPKRVSFVLPLPGKGKAEVKVVITSSLTEARNTKPVSTGDTKVVRKATRPPESPPTSEKAEGPQAVLSSPSFSPSSSSSPPTPPTPPPPPPKAPQQVRQSEPVQQPPLPDHVTKPLPPVRDYLADEDQDCGFAQIRPASKQDAFILLEATLHGKQVAYHTNAYYIFGFAAAQNEDEKRHIGSFYKQLLLTTSDPQSIFRALTHAVDTNTLVDLFNTHGFPTFAPSFPHVTEFLHTTPTHRPTVWPLIQYLRIPKISIEPAPVLKRDYGFQFCKNHEELQRLKGIYSAILKHTSPLELHGACVHGRLAEFAMLRGAKVEERNRRFLVNDWPSLSVGWENEEGLGKHRVLLFRSSGKL